MANQDFVGSKKHFTDNEFKDMNPLLRFKEWLELEVAQNPLATVMSFATVSNNKAKVRPVILGSVDEMGFYFDTIEKSDKVKEMEDNPNVAFSIFWWKTFRSVRVEGKVERILPSSKSAFYSWQKAVKINVQISENKNNMISEEEYQALQKQHKVLEEKYKGVDDIPKPHFIVSFKIVPHTIEFQDIFPGDLEERIRFNKNPNLSWEFARLHP